MSRLPNGRTRLTIFMNLTGKFCLSIRPIWHALFSVIIVTTISATTNYNAVLAPAYAQSDTITLGAAIAFTGKHAINGIHTRNGYRLAVDRINQSGGIKISGKSFKLALKFYDDASTPAQTALMTEQLIQEDGIQFMLGPYGSAATNAAAEITEKYGVPMIEAAGAAQTLFTQNYLYLFAVVTTTDQYLADVIHLAAQNAKKLGKAPADIKIALAFKKDAFSQQVRSGIVATAKQYEMEIVIDDKLPKKIQDLSSTLTKVHSLNPDLLLISGHAKAAATAARQLRDWNISVPMIAMTHCEAANLIERFGDAVNHFLCPTQWTPTLKYQDSLFGSAADYDRLFRKTYPDYAAVPYQAAQASAAVMTFKDAFERAESLDRNTVRAALASTALDTFYGRIEFSPSGANRAKPMVLRQIQKGQFKVITPTRAPTKPGPPPLQPSLSAVKKSG